MNLEILIFNLILYEIFRNRETNVKVLQQRTKANVHEGPLLLCLEGYFIDRWNSDIKPTLYIGNIPV